MSQFLDFSSGARKNEPPPPQKKAPGRPPRRPSGRNPGRSWKDRVPKRQGLLIIALAAAVVLAAVVVFKFTSHNSGKSAAAASARYCVLAGQFEQVSLRTGAASAPGVYDGPPQKMKIVVGQMGGTLQELRSVAPKAVRHDEGVVIDAVKRAAGGDLSRVKAPGFATTAKRVSTYPAQYCSAGAGSGEG